MSREYPRFLFSNPKNTKSKGPFIIHTLEPELIMKISDHVPDKNKYPISYIIEPKPQHMYYLALLTDISKPRYRAFYDKIPSIVEDAVVWAKAQLKESHIIF